MNHFLLCFAFAHAMYLKVEDTLKGPGINNQYKFAIHSIGGFFGFDKPYIFTNFSSEPKDAKAFISIMNSHDQAALKLYLNLQQNCSNFTDMSFKHFSSGSIEKIIHTTDIYTILIISCEPSITYQLSIETHSPYGHLTGEYIALVPFYAGFSAVYLILLVAWCISLCIYWDSSIFIQRYLIPFILLLCILEHMMNFWYWEFININGHKSMIMLVLASFVKAAKDSLGRALLIAAAKGWGVVHPNIQQELGVIMVSGITYFIFDILYEIVIKTQSKSQLWTLLLVTIPLIILNTIIFYLVFAMFARLFYQLKQRRQHFKLGLIKKFAFFLGLAGVISVIWTVLEVLCRIFLTVEQTWPWMWLYTGIWDIIFIFLVISLMIIWRINAYSKDLAFSQEIGSNDDDLSREEEEKTYGVELSVINH